MKDKLREEWLLKRGQIPDERRKNGANLIFERLKPILSDHTHILSYASFQSELSTLILNQNLLKEKRLFLPRVVEDSLWIYRVTNLKDQLIQSSYGILEPDPKKCERLNPEKLSCVIVPAVAFDSKNHRLGYGKGFFDIFLDKYRSNFISIGIGFTESYSIKPFPSKPHDIALDQIILV